MTELRPRGSQRFKGTDGAERAAEKAKPGKAEKEKEKAAKAEEPAEEVGETAAGEPRAVPANGGRAGGGETERCHRSRSAIRGRRSTSNPS